MIRLDFDLERSHKPIGKSNINNLSHNSFIFNRNQKTVEGCKKNIAALRRSGHLIMSM